MLRTLLNYDQIPTFTIGLMQEQLDERSVDLKATQFYSDLALCQSARDNTGHSIGLTLISIRTNDHKNVQRTSSLCVPIH